MAGSLGGRCRADWFGGIWLGKELFDEFAAHVAEIAAAGRLRGDPVAAAQALWAGAHGVISLVITKPYFDWRPTLEADMLHALFEGVLVR